jgi:putative transposase
MPFYAPIPLGSRFEATRQSLDGASLSPLRDALPERLITQAADAAGIDLDASDATIYTPALTLWTYLAQVVSGNGTCVAAVARLMVLLLALGRAPCAAHTGAYCKARAKLVVPWLGRLTYDVGNATEDAAPAAWRCLGRRALLVDGFEVTAEDTPANQAVYPQPATQQPGLGFATIRVVVLLTLATASLVGTAWGPHRGKETGETALFRQLLDLLRANDLVVADRYYCSYWMIALLVGQGVDVAFRLHQLRHYDFRRGQRLGRDDHRVEWLKPQRPDWMSKEFYAQIPETLTVREVRFRVTQPGYRSEEIIVATTLVDADQYSKAMIADIYHQRWHVEIDIRAIKQTLSLSHIYCKSPGMIDRHLWVTFLGYNLIRKVMAAAACLHGLCPRQLSFAGALQILEAFRWLILWSEGTQQLEVVAVVLAALAAHQVGHRPGRVEPRRVKRRHDKYQQLGKPRPQARAELLAGRG